MAQQDWLGFDFGLRRIGVAVGQSVSKTATPLLVLHQSTSQEVDWSIIAALYQEWRPWGCVVGLPLRQDGSLGPLGTRLECFTQELAQRLGCAVFQVDERLSSHEAQARRTSRSKGRSRAPLDAEAAAIILETWFDSPDFAASQHSGRA